MRAIRLIAKQENQYFEDAGQITTQPAASVSEKLTDLIFSSTGDLHIVTHPACWDCGSLMVLLNDGKFCPNCGRLVLASEEWRSTHVKFSGVA